MKPNPKCIEQLLGELRRAQNLTHEDKPQEAMRVLLDVVAEAKRIGVDSAHLYWALAVACDYSGELEMAFENVTTAIAKDPLAVPFRHSFDLIANRVRAALADPERPLDDPSTPRLYALLTRSGEADVGAHLAMVRFHLARGDQGEARALVEAVTRLYPASAEAWSARAEVAAARGDAEAAEQARIEAAALGVADPVFAVSGQAAA